jgi:hypothetical protein
MPLHVQQVLSVLSLFAGDINFMRPGCMGTTSFPAVFAINIAGASLSLLSLSLCLQQLMECHSVCGVERTGDGLGIRSVPLATATCAARRA